MAWHVDDLKISHKGESVVKDIIKQLEKQYSKMSITTGPVHVYCRMKLIFENKQVKVEMVDFLKDTIGKFLEDCNIKTSTPGALHLFDVNFNTY